MRRDRTRKSIAGKFEGLETPAILERLREHAGELHIVELEADNACFLLVPARDTDELAN